MNVSEAWSNSAMPKKMMVFPSPSEKVNREGGGGGRGGGGEGRGRVGVVFLFDALWMRSLQDIR